MVTGIPHQGFNTLSLIHHQIDIDLSVIFWAQEWMFLISMWVRGGPVPHISPLGYTPEDWHANAYPKRCFGKGGSFQIGTQMLHVWNIYLPTFGFNLWDQCRSIFHNIPVPWSMWVCWISFVYVKPSRVFQRSTRKRRAPFFCSDWTDTWLHLWLATWKVGPY